MPDQSHSTDDDRLARRSFLTIAAAAPIAMAARQAFGADASPASSAAHNPIAVRPSMVIREKDPENFEAPFEALDGPVTPNDQFYIRSHFPAPDVDVKTWRLKVEGAVDKPVEIGLDELMAMKATSAQVTLECAGNGRVFLVPKVEGAQWQLGAASNAVWTGVPLADVLARAGVKASAVELLFEGIDEGTTEKPSKPVGKFHFGRSLPMTKVKVGDVLLAYQMNGEPLTKSHGFPVRLVVPGWYGMASVKWIDRIVALEKPYHGYFQGTEYAYWTYVDGAPTRIALTEVPVKSQIARPAEREVVPKGKPYRMTGAAWVGEAMIAKVEVSTDGGATYAAAKLIGDAVPNAWRLWEYEWQVPNEPALVTLKSRATDDRGRVQPVDRDHNFETYMIHHILPIDVIVK